MPTRWWLPVVGVDPRKVKPEYLHAAVSRWFDRTLDEHRASSKPYSLSPLADGPGGGVGFQVGSLHQEVDRTILAATGTELRLGSQEGLVGDPELLREATWQELLATPPARQLVVELQSPTTFRSGDRASPIPNMGTILSGLLAQWLAWSDADWPFDDRVRKAAWISDCELRSQVVKLPNPGNRARPLTISGATGRVVARSSSATGAMQATPLLELANYSGIGSYTEWGLGVVAVASALEGNTVPTRTAVSQSQACGRIG